MTNNPQKIKSHLVQKCGFSDHLYVIYNWASIGLKPTKKYIVVRDYSNFNLAQANAELWASDKLKIASNSQYPETITSLIHSEVTRILDVKAPLQKIQISSKVPRFASAETKELIVKKDIQYQRAKRTKSADDICEYNTTKNRVRKLLKLDKKKITKKMFLEVDGYPKKQWQSVKKTLGWNKFSSPAMIIENGKTKTSAK